MPANLPFSLRSLPYQPGTMEQVASRLVQHARCKGQTRLVIPVNGQVFVLAHEQPAFADVIRRGEEVVLDGISVYTAARMLGDQNVHRVPGVDLLMRICECASDQPMRIMLLGGRPGSGERLRSLLAERCPQLIVGVHCPPMGFERSEETLAVVKDAIRDFAPDIVFVAFGAPKQELFMDRHIRPLNVPVAMAVGGSFEMITGMVRRAPQWMQEAGMEWFFRMVTEPRRLLWRYVYTNTVFVWVLLRELVTREPAPAQ